jgi:hypothetical protein
VAMLHLQRFQSYFWQKFSHFWRQVMANNSLKSDTVSGLRPATAPLSSNVLLTALQ